MREERNLCVCVCVCVCVVCGVCVCGVCVWCVCVCGVCVACVAGTEILAIEVVFILHASCLTIDNKLETKTYTFLHKAH